MRLAFGYRLGLGLGWGSARVWVGVRLGGLLGLDLCKAIVLRLGVRVRVTVRVLV